MLKHSAVCRVFFLECLLGFLGVLGGIIPIMPKKCHLKAFWGCLCCMVLSFSVEMDVY
jgi:hypothetical protein